MITTNSTRRVHTGVGWPWVDAIYSKLTWLYLYCFCPGTVQCTVCLLTLFLFCYRSYSVQISNSTNTQIGAAITAKLNELKIKKDDQGWWLNLSTKTNHKIPIKNNKFRTIVCSWLYVVLVWRCYNFVAMATHLDYMGVRGLLHILYIVSVQ